MESATLAASAQKKFKIVIERAVLNSYNKNLLANEALANIAYKRQKNQL